MKKIISGLIPVFSVILLCGVAHGAERSEDAHAPTRATAVRANASQTAARQRAPSMVAGLGGGGGGGPSVQPFVPVAPAPATPMEKAIIAISAGTPEPTPAAGSSNNCRTEFRDCMDQFCLMDSTEGERCACSDNINQSKPLIKEINDIMTRASRAANEGVERERYGAHADWAFGTGQKAKSRGIDFMAWIGGGSSAALDADEEIGRNLYQMARASCASRLEACGPDARMEEILYERLITNDCRAFNAFLGEQKKIAESNLALAERQVRAARWEMRDVTNRFNAGECLVAFESCVSNKGGCGDNFENCLDAGLLSMRARACDNILDQCLASRSYVTERWEERTVTILREAAAFAERDKRGSCLLRIDACLEDSCRIGTRADCLSNINVAAGICPIINECETLVPGMKNIVSGNLGFIRSRFCQNDVTKCLQDKCGIDYSNPACIGEQAVGIAAMCPQEMFPSCANNDDFDTILASALWQVDSQLTDGCINYFADVLNRTCGADMVSCISINPAIETALTMDDLNRLITAGRDGVSPIRMFARTESDQLFKQLESDPTVKRCVGNAGKNVNVIAKSIAVIQAEDRLKRAWAARKAELSRAMSVADARKNCDEVFNARRAGNSSHAQSENKPGTWVTTHVFEEALRNCKICTVQKVCARGGTNNSGLGSAGAMAAGGAGAGMVAGPWGALIGGAVGGVVGLIGGKSKAQMVCQEIESCDNTNM
ncbi:MAG: hypothetical protein FWF34_01070 [Alphaproteobacteria bacterium]|nr:hypothetical protein [Alphaproteobacteria bacterium]MCL2889834.1 hypothetical protein [Alphaproteobacteria bacterium]